MTACVSRIEVLALTGWSSSLLKLKVRKGQVQTRLTSKKLPNGQFEREYVLSSLPAEAQRKYFLKSPAAAAAGSDVVHGAPNRSLGLRSTLENLPKADAQSQGERRRYVALPPEKQSQAEARFEAISPMVDISLGHQKFPIILTDGREIGNMNDLADFLGSKHGVSGRTIYRWFDRWEHDQKNGLADLPRADKGTSRYFQDNPVLGEYAIAKYVGANDSARHSIRAIFDMLQRECRERRLDPPSYWTVRAFLKGDEATRRRGIVPKAVEIFAREGERAYHDRCEMYVLPDYEKTAANDVWVTDHCIHDVMCWNDCFEGLPKGAAFRPWLSAIIDFRTRKALGLYWSINPSSDTVPLRQALLAYGPPRELYMDNGKDFVSLAKKNIITPAAAGVLRRIGIQPKHCLPKHPQSKHVERWFRTVHQRFDVMWGNAYAGTSPATRPDACAELEKRHKMVLKNGGRSPLPRASEFIGACQQWILGYYNAEHKHTGRAMDGRTPDAVFDELYPIEQRRKIDPRELDVLLRKPIERKLVEGGCVEINNTRYEPADPWSRDNLFHHLREQVLVCCDPASIGEAIITNLDGNEFLGNVRASKLLEHGPISQPDYKASLADRRSKVKQIKTLITGLAVAQANAGNIPEVERWIRRSGATSTVPEIIPARAVAMAASAPAMAAAPVGYDDWIDIDLHSEEK
jgi:putative transposase